MQRLLRFAILFLVLAITLVSTLRAQLCQGSLGDPIVNITFGAGPNPGNKLAAGSSNYNYVVFDCPPDGCYTVTNRTIDCFSASWHTLQTDHTGDPNGYFMLVNASYQPSAFYVDTIRGLCGTTSYEFAAWIINIIKTTGCGNGGIQPNLTFRIEKLDGTLIKSYDSGNIPPASTPTWKQFGFPFNTPTGVSDVVIRITNNAAGGCGNDLALDDITFRACGPQLTPSILGATGSTAPLCVGVTNNYTFNCTVSGGFTTPEYQWERSFNGGPWTDIPGANSSTLTQTIGPSSAVGDRYSYRMAAGEQGNLGSSQCRVVSNPLTIIITGSPAITVSSNSPVCEGSSILLSASGAVSYLWNGVNGYSSSGGNVSIVNAQMSDAGTYSVEGTSAEGCKNNNTVQVAINPKPTAVVNPSTLFICSGQSAQLSASGGLNYLWMPAGGLSSNSISNPVANPADTTVYTVVVDNQYQCRDSVTVTLNVAERPVANAGPDIFLVDFPSAKIFAKAKGQALEYSWTPAMFIDDPSKLQPVVSPPSDTTYVLEITSTLGCGVAKDSVTVRIIKDIYIPTAFSPNGDGLNDTWTVPGLIAFDEYDISIFNRQGQLLHTMKNSPRPWDGRYKGVLQPAGAYVYMVSILNNRRFYKGTLMLVR